MRNFIKGHIVLWLSAFMAGGIIGEIAKYFFRHK